MPKFEKIVEFATRNKLTTKDAVNLYEKYMELREIERGWKSSIEEMKRANEKLREKLENLAEKKGAAE